MVFAGITADCKTQPVFVESGFKINRCKYLDDILTKRNSSLGIFALKNGDPTYQQDSAPAHGANVVQKWCAYSFSDFISVNGMKFIERSTRHIKKQLCLKMAFFCANTRL